MKTTTPSSQSPLSNLPIKLYVDGADLASILRHAGKPYVQGFTTNPSLLAKAGVKDYEAFVRAVTEAVPLLPVSFEVLEGADVAVMAKQVRRLAEWGAKGCCYVKVPVLTTEGVFTGPLIEELRKEGIRLNVTALTTRRHVNQAFSALCETPNVPCIVSVFAGRVADRGRSPHELMRWAKFLAGAHPGSEVLWASTREVGNIRDAIEAGVHIITVPDALLEKAEKEWGKDVEEDDMTLAVLSTFGADAKASGLTIA